MKNSLLLFFLLQVLDVATTIVALALGGREQNPLVGHFMALGTIQGLIVSKVLVFALALAIVLLLRRQNAIRWANIVFSLIVAWNLTTIVRLLMAH
jgi:hypothetical protein